MADNTVSTQFVVESKQAVAGAEEASSAVKVSAEEIRQEADKAANAYDKVGDHAQKSSEVAAKSWQKQVSAVTEFIGKITAAIGVATGFYRIGVKIREVWDNVGKSLERASEQAEQFAQTLDYSDAAGSIRSIDKQIVELSNKIGDLQERSALGRGISSLFNSESIAGFERQISDLELIRSSLVQKAANDRAEIERAAAEKAAKDKREIAEREAADDSRRASDFQVQTARLNAEEIEDAQERARKLAQIEEDLLDIRARKAGERERSAIEDLKVANARALEREITRIVEEESRKRADAAREYIQAQIDLYRELEGAIQSASQAQQQASQSLTTGFGSDIRAIRQLLEVRGGWKK